MAAATTNRSAGRTDRTGGTVRNRSLVHLMWRTTVGKKAVMAVTGLVMLGYLVAHMAGNLKIFSGPEEFNDYSHWLRTIGQPAVGHEWVLWLVRVVLLAAVVLHIVAAYQLTRRDHAARPVAYAHRGGALSRFTGPSYAARTMRWSGVIVALFVVWHILDLTTGTVNPHGVHGQPYENVVASFSTWYGNVIYVAGVVAVGLHLRHGFRSAAATLGVTSPRTRRGLSLASTGLALALTAGFLAVPFAVMTGVVS